jgi:hypothetical protein
MTNIKMRHIAYLLFLVSFLGCSNPDSVPVMAGGTSDTETAMLSGILIFEDGQTSEAATVKAIPYNSTPFNNNNTELFTTQTDQKGWFAFEMLPVGLYNIFGIEANGYLSLKDSLFISGRPISDFIDTLKPPVHLYLELNSDTPIDKEYANCWVIGVNIDTPLYAMEIPQSNNIQFLFKNYAQGRYNLKIFGSPDCEPKDTSIWIIKPVQNNNDTIRASIDISFSCFNGNYSQDSSIIRSFLDTNGLDTIGIGDVSTRTANRITTLDMNALNTSDLIVPTSLGNLHGLCTLSLANKNIKSIPATLGDLPNLSYLELTNNQIQALPASIVNLTNLLALDIRNNLIKNLPAGMAEMINLKYLWMSGNPIDSLPAEICQLKNMEFLLFDFTNLTSLPEHIGNLIYLENLSADNCQIKSIPTSIGELKLLRFLTLDYNQISKLPESLIGMKNLTWFRFYHNEICSVSTEMSQWLYTQYHYYWAQDTTQRCGQ